MESYLQTHRIAGEKLTPSAVGSFAIERAFTESGGKADDQVSGLIRRNLEGFREAGAVLASSFRRLEDLRFVYSQEGAAFFVALDRANRDSLIGGAGIGPLHGLPMSEGVGEVRDLVVEEEYRSRGLGARLLKRCLEEAQRMGYRQIYLETTPQMEHAQKLFGRFGFRPVKHSAARDGTGASAVEAVTVPCYFVFDT